MNFIKLSAVWRTIGLYATYLPQGRLGQIMNSNVTVIRMEGNDKERLKVRSEKRG
jgi:hypothetical protein